jgi:hypothetical protein
MLNQQQQKCIKPYVISISGSVGMTFLMKPKHFKNLKGVEGNGLVGVSLFGHIN